MNRPTLSNVNDQYGAPMGRADHHAPNDDVPRKFYLQRVRLNNGGYDRGGAYWGSGQRLYWAHSEAVTEGEWQTDEVDMYFRASDREAAKDHVRSKFELATFFN